MDGQAVTRSAEADLAVCEAATPGDWVARWQQGQTDKHKYTHEIYLAALDDVIFLLTAQDATFIAAARTALPFWIREAERYKAALERIESFAEGRVARFLADGKYGTAEELRSLSKMAQEALTPPSNEHGDTDA